MADSPAQAADWLKAGADRIRENVAAELEDQAELSRNAMAADTRRDRGLTAESWVIEDHFYELGFRVTNTATDPKGRFIATILEYGYNDGQPDAVVEREFDAASRRVPPAIADAFARGWR